MEVQQFCFTLCSSLAFQLRKLNKTIGHADRNYVKIETRQSDCHNDDDECSQALTNQYFGFLKKQSKLTHQDFVRKTVETFFFLQETSLVQAALLD